MHTKFIHTTNNNTTLKTKLETYTHVEEIVDYWLNLNATNSFIIDTCIDVELGTNYIRVDLFSDTNEYKEIIAEILFLKSDMLTHYKPKVRYEDFFIKDKNAHNGLRFNDELSEKYEESFGIYMHEFFCMPTCSSNKMIPFLMSFALSKDARVEVFRTLDENIDELNIHGEDVDLIPENILYANCEILARENIMYNFNYYFLKESERWC